MIFRLTRLRPVARINAAASSSRGRSLLGAFETKPSRYRGSTSATASCPQHRVVDRLVLPVGVVPTSWASSSGSAVGNSLSSDDEGDFRLFGSRLNEFEPSEREREGRSNDLKVSASNAVAEQQAGVVVVVLT